MFGEPKDWPPSIVEWARGYNWGQKIKFPKPVKVEKASKSGNDVANVAAEVSTTAVTEEPKAVADTPTLPDNSVVVGARRRRVMEAMAGHRPTGSFSEFNKAAELIAANQDTVSNTIADEISHVPATDQVITAIPEPVEDITVEQENDSLSFIDRLRKLREDGGLTAQALIPFADDLTDLMNIQALGRPGSQAAFRLDPAVVKEALARPDLVYRGGGVTVRIINHRILQAVSGIAGFTKKQILNPTGFWGDACKLAQPKSELLGLGRGAYERFLLALEVPRNRHIQSAEQLAKASGLSREHLYDFFADLSTAYEKTDENYYQDNDDALVPGETLENLAKFLNCNVSTIIHPKTWRRALELSGWQAQPKPQPPEPVKAPTTLLQGFLADTIPVPPSVPENQGVSDNEKIRMEISSLGAQGKLTAKALVPFAEYLAEMMNLNATKSARYNDSFALSAQDVSLALSKPSLVYSSAGMTMRIINMRIMQTLKEIAGRDVTAVDLWGDNCQQQPTTNRLTRLGRGSYDRLLKVVARTDNTHIQSLEHLTAAAGLGNVSILNLFNNVSTAYKNGTSSDPVPNQILEKIASALNCEPESIIAVKTWQAAVDEKTKLAPEKPKPRVVANTPMETPVESDISVVDAQAAREVPPVVTIQLPQPAEPVQVAQPATPIVETPPVEVALVQPPVQAVAAIQPSVGDDFRQAAVALAQAYGGLQKSSAHALGMAAFKAVHRIEGSDSALGLLADKFFDGDIDQVRAASDAVQNQLLGAANFSGGVVRNIQTEWMVAALRTFANTQDRLERFAAQNLFAKIDYSKAEYTEIAAPLDGAFVRDARERLMGRMVAALQGQKAAA